MIRPSIRQKQNQPFGLQLRSSLKKTMTSKKKPQKNQGRMSMLPLKREQMSATIQSQIVSSRPSTSIMQPNNNLLNTIGHNMDQSFYNSCRKSISKQTIISNLVNKLDEKQELRSIIETKLKRNSYGAHKQLVYTSDFQPYASNISTQGARNFNSSQKIRNLDIQNNFYETVTQHQNNSSVQLKLQKCQQELTYFKSIVVDLSKSTFILTFSEVKKLEGEPINNFPTARNQKRLNFQESPYLNFNECIKFLNCKCNKKKIELNNMKNVETQTCPLQENISSKKQEDSYESDFFDNLEKTLKILDKTKLL